MFYKIKWPREIVEYVIFPTLSFYDINTVQKLSLIVFLLFWSRNIKTNAEFRVETNETSLYNMYLMLKSFSLLFTKLRLAEKKTFFLMKMVCYKNYLRCLSLYFSEKLVFAKLFVDESSLMYGLLLPT
jgi:hypothetical protein